jgi:hypothetical protein
LEVNKINDDICKDLISASSFQKLFTHVDVLAEFSKSVYQSLCCGLVPHTWRNWDAFDVSFVASEKGVNGRNQGEKVLIRMRWITFLSIAIF